MPGNIKDVLVFTRPAVTYTGRAAFVDLAGDGAVLSRPRKFGRAELGSELTKTHSKQERNDRQFARCTELIKYI